MFEVCEHVGPLPQSARHSIAPRPELVVRVFRLAQPQVHERLDGQAGPIHRLFVRLGDAPGGTLRGQHLFRLRPRGMPEFERVPEGRWQVGQKRLDQ